MKPSGVTSAGRDQGCEPPAPVAAVGDPRRTAGGIGSSELVLDAAIGTHGQSVGRDQRSEQIADEPLERGAVAGIDGGVGMEREAVEPARPFEPRILSPLRMPFRQGAF